MRVFKNAWFERYAKKQKISDKALAEAVEKAEKGLIDADLGGGVIKQRVARPGQGKSGGFRTIILYLQESRAFFVYGFAKSKHDNIEEDEEVYFKKMAKRLLEVSDEHIAEMIRKGQFSEVNYGQEIQK